MKKPKLTCKKEISFGSDYGYTLKKYRYMDEDGRLRALVESYKYKHQPEKNYETERRMDEYGRVTYSRKNDVETYIGYCNTDGTGEDRYNQCRVKIKRGDVWIEKCLNKDGDIVVITTSDEIVKSVDMLGLNGKVIMRTTYPNKGIQEKEDSLGEYFNKFVVDRIDMTLG